MGAVNMGATAAYDTALFESGPLLGVQRRIGLIKGKEFHVARRAMLVVLVGWVPLILFAIVDGITSLIWEVGAHARYLLAAPLLIVAEAECASRLSAIVRNFVEAGIVPESERGRFDAAISSTR
jgi:hypothetical protein